MSRAYTADGRRRSSMTHATRSWTCPCGKTVWGNGGKSSHRRACATWREEEIRIHRAVIETLQRNAGPYPSIAVREGIAHHRAKLKELGAVDEPEAS